MNFEQKLASMQPKLLREIELKEAVLRHIKEPGLKAVLSRRSRVAPSLGRYIAVGLTGFFLGVAATYFAMQPTIETQSPVTEQYVVLPLDDATIGTLRRPLDLARIPTERVAVRKIDAPTILTPLSRI